FLYTGLIIFFSASIADAFDYPGKEQYIQWLAIILAIDAVVAVPFARLRFENKAGKFAFLKILNIGVNVFLNIFFLIFCRKIIASEFLPELKPYVEIFY